jgi:cyclic-di-AMP phosphodiesterase PgpH
MKVSLNNKLRIAYSVVIFVLASFLVFVMFPKEKKFAYDFQKGSPWLHDDLIAPFDFPVYKSSDEIELEKDSIRRNFIPFLKRDALVVDEVIHFYDTRFKEYWESNILSNNQKLNFNIFKKKPSLEVEFDKMNQSIAQVIKKTYNQGVIFFNDSLAKKNAEFYLLDGNTRLGKFSYNDFISTKFVPKLIKNSILENWREVSEMPDTVLVEISEFLIEQDNFLPNIIDDDATTQADLKDRFNSISPTRGLVQKGELIVLKGNIVDNKTNSILLSLKNEIESDSGSVNKAWVYIGIGLLVITIFLVFFLYLWIFHRNTIMSPKHISFIFLQLLIFITIVFLISNYTSINIYLIPIVIVPILLFTFLHFRIAFYSFIVLLFLLGFFVPNSFQYLFINLIAALIALYTLRTIQRRRQLFLSVFAVMLAYSVTYFGFIIIREGNLASINWTDFLWLGGNSLLLISFFPLMYVYEKLFGFISDVTLMELSDTNHPALRALAEKAPGTFQHSMQVANLAEAAIRKIGGNPLLVRTGALYHDIGKTEIPQFFIENQSGKNPHNDLSFDKSAEIIIRHVSKGVEIAKKYRLPEQIIDFIKTHHGKSLTKYFYNSYVNENEGKEVDKERFMYPGPKPLSREMAVLMMADSVEAASRSLKEFNPENISKLIDNIVNTQLEDGQFEEVDITFRDVSEVKRVFKEKIMNIYHARIEYPELKETAKS